MEFFRQEYWSRQLFSSAGDLPDPDLDRKNPGLLHCKLILYHLSYQGSQPPGKPKKIEHQRTDAFELWCWRRLFRVSWTARRSHPSILKEINPEYSLEGLLLNPKLQYFGHLVGKANSLEKTLMLGKTEGKRRGGGRE